LKASLTKVGAAQSLHASTVKEITVAEYLANPTEWHLVDVREEKELTNLGPITGMVAHFALGDAIRLASMNQLPTDWQGKKVLLYCGSGKRSVVAAREILALVPGLNLFSLAGGFKAWKVSQSQ
jgi:rhodanese-related sulfurtransferase